MIFISFDMNAACHMLIQRGNISTAYSKVKDNKQQKVKSKKQKAKCHYICIKSFLSHACDDDCDAIAATRNAKTEM